MQRAEMKVSAAWLVPHAARRHRRKTSDICEQCPFVAALAIIYNPVMAIEFKRSFAVLFAAAGLGIAPPAHADTIYINNPGQASVEAFSALTGAGSVYATSVPNPTGIAVDRYGNIYADNRGNTIIEIAPDGSRSVFAGVFGSTHYGLWDPSGMAFDSAGNLFVANTGTNTIEEFSPQGVGTLFASGMAGTGGLAFDSHGDLFVAEFQGSQIEEFAADGTRSVFADMRPLGGQPSGIAVDASGNVYVAANNNFIFRFTPDGTESVFAGTGYISGGIFNPRGLGFDSAGNLFVVNNGDNTIYEVSPDGTLAFFAQGGLGTQGQPSLEYLAIVPEVPQPSALKMGTALLVAGGIVLGMRRARSICSAACGKGHKASAL